MKKIHHSTGFFGIGILNCKRETNLGTLWRSAFIFGASFIFTINKKYKKQSSDVLQSWSKIPSYHYNSVEEFYKHMPYNCRLVGVEFDQNATPIKDYEHPERCIYLLGAEDIGLTNEAKNKCHEMIVLPGEHCLNVAVSGSIVMYDRLMKSKN